MENADKTLAKDSYTENSPVNEKQLLLTYRTTFKQPKKRSKGNLETTIEEVSTQLEPTFLVDNNITPTIDLSKIAHFLYLSFGSSNPSSVAHDKEILRYSYDHVEQK